MDYMPCLSCMKIRCQRKMLILHFMKYEQEGFKKPKNKPHKAAKGGHGKGKSKMGCTPNNVPFAPKPKTPPPPKKDNHGLRGSKNLKPGALSLYVGDGHRAAVEAIGTYHLELPSGLVIVLNNCHYAPSITRGVISVSHLFYDGFINRFDENNVISVSKNNLVYFMAVPRDGIFEIDMSCSNTNDSSMYALAIKEPKLIWTLLSGGTVVFQKKVENQLGKTINSLRSDRKGYPKETIGYSFYSLSENKVFIAQNTEFFKNNLIDLKASRSMEDLKLIQEEDTNHSLDNSLDHEKDDQEIDKPQSDINPIQKSSRTRRAPNRMCLYIDAEEHELGDLCEPANSKVAPLDPEYKKWLDAMNVEMQSMKDIDVWVLVELPLNARTISSKWLFKKKTDMDGAVYVFKARLVVKGFTQTHGVDYEETFSPVADIRAIRILIAIAVYYDYKLWKMDVKTTFLNRHLFEKVYMEKPEGFVNLKYPNHICKLKRSIYGLKQAFR
nr:hypothetical protein [Tanacetum cinerariifolium]